jgi:IS4 transposase
VEEEADYLQRVTTHPDTTTMVGYYERLGRFGTVTLVWKTGVEHSAQEVYEAYKQRNEIEVLFDRYKNFIAGDTLYMKDRYVLEGWLLANFIAMLAYYKLYNRLREAKLLRKHSPKDILEMSRAIYQMKIQGRWTCSEVPQRVRILFASLGLGYLN